jgi:hypothetical protein
MALRGNLSEISLPDIFQLVTFSRKSGVLHILRFDGARGSIWFRAGEVYFAQSNWRSDPIGERLVRAQRITPKALERALSLRAEEPENGRRLGEILVAEGYIAPQVIEQFVSEQMQETIFDLMRWDEGEFEFEPITGSPEEDIGLAVSLENVIMEGSRRLDEWNRIKRKIPSGDVVFKMATAPGEGSFEISLKPVEWKLLLLVDGSRSVTDLARATARTDFEVSRVLYGLFSAGLLEFAEDDQAVRLRQERVEREKRIAEIQAERRAEAQATSAAYESVEQKEDAGGSLPAGAAPAERQPTPPDLATQGSVESGTASPPPAPVQAESAPRRRPEVPEFLGADRVAPSPEDMAVLSEMMGAVLSEPAVAPASSQSVKEPEVPGAPADAPTRSAAPQAPEPAGVLVPVPSVADLIGDLTELRPDSPTVREAIDAAARAAAQRTEQLPALVPPERALPSAEQAVPEPLPSADESAADLATAGESIALADEQAALSSLAEAPAPAEPAEPGPSVPAPSESEKVEPVPLGSEPTRPGRAVETPSETSSFAADLMALGLGELPTAPLVSPSAERATPAPTPPVTEPVASVDAAEVQPAVPAAAAPGDLAQVIESLGGEIDSDFEPAVEPMGAHASSPGAMEPQDQEPVPLSTPGQTSEPGPVQPEVDFSSLRESLDLGADDVQSVILEPPAVISTDRYLFEDDLAYGGELTEELSALTGADRPNRPTVSVNRLPEQGSGGVLKRDTKVDRETVLKIIDGIQNL